MFIRQAFKEFKDSRLKQVKSSADYNTCIEIYAKTELFDITATYQDNREVVVYPEDGDDHITYYLNASSFNMPFHSVFINTVSYETDKQSTYRYLFLREFSPNVITGCFYLKTKVKGHFDVACALPFQISNFEAEKNCIEYKVCKKDIHNIENSLKGKVKINPNPTLQRYKGLTDTPCIKELEILNTLYSDLCNVREIFDKLCSKEVVVDTPVTPKVTYQRYKGTRKYETALKIIDKPSYIVLGNKGIKVDYKTIKYIGTLVRDFSFSVRGHWRKISTNSLGKDRNSNYTVKGFTWVISHIKGNGELRNSIKIIKR